MPKGYLVANIRVQDKEKFSTFSGMASPVIKAYGGKIFKKCYHLWRSRNECDK